MTRRPAFWDTVWLVFRRPWPWVVRYVAGVVPAFLVALMLLVPLQRWVSQPLVAEALGTRSLDLLIEALLNPIDEIRGGPLLLVGVVLVPLVWICMQLLWLFLEGGVLITYVQAQRPTAREFVRACTRWFPSFLMIAVLTVLATGAVVGIAAAGVALVQTFATWLWLRAIVVAGGGVAVVGISAAAELTRAAAVVAGDRNVWRSFGAAGRVAAQRLLPLVALILGVLLLRVLLLLAQRELLGWIPLSWWLPSLLIQQSLQILVTGWGVLRRAGEVALVLSATDPDPFVASDTDAGASTV